MAEMYRRRAVDGIPALASMDLIQRKGGRADGLLRRGKEVYNSK